ncbi:hypothetical protein ABIB29_003350 [Arthrobacter sp. UYEF36]
MSDIAQTCTHQDASLADGWVEDCWVECPLHAPDSTSVKEVLTRRRPSYRSAPTK